MICLNHGLLLRPKLSSFSTLVFQHTVILLLLTHSCRALDLFTPPSCCPYCMIFGLACSLAGGLALIIGVFIVWKCKKSTIISYISSVKEASRPQKGLAEKEAQLQKQSKRTHEELDAWAAVFTPLLELQGRLKNQREEFRLQLEELEKEREENKENICSVEKLIAESEKQNTTDKTEGYLRDKQSLLNAQWRLEKRKEEVEKQQLNMEKLLQKTEGMMATIAKRQKEVENHLELIRLHLEEAETQDDKVRLHNN